MVLRHHNEAESLNAVQKMDWEWKLGEIPGPKVTSISLFQPIMTEAGRGPRGISVCLKHWKLNIIQKDRVCVAILIHF